MKFGYFDDVNKEYVITTPQAPLPWINYLGSDSFFSLISNTGGGYCFYKDARLRRIIRFRYNNSEGDLGGRFFYIKEAGNGAFRDAAAGREVSGEAGGTPAWSPTFLPCKTPLDSYKCRHGLGYTVFESSKRGLLATITLTVPKDDSCELQLVTLRNNSSETKKLNFYACVEWCLWDAADDAENYQRNLNIGECEAEGAVIYHKTEYRERRNHYSFYGTGALTSGFDTDRESFTGRFGGWENPECVAKGISRNSETIGWYPIASHRIELTLSPGEEKSFVFVLGYAENEKSAKFAEDGSLNKEKARLLLKKYSSKAAVRAALADLSEYWDSLLKNFRLSSDIPELNRMANIWNQYQCMVTFNMSRSTSYFESGMGRGMGFRDSCQDIFGFVHMIPERARERIIDIASVQKPDGSTYHQYQPLTKKGNSAIGSGFNDDPLWLIAAVASYVKETGDSAILAYPTPFDTTCGTEVPLLEHLRRSVNYTLSHLGPHGLPLIGHADWNDCLNLNCFSENPGESFQCLSPADGDSTVAESVFIAAMFVLYGKEYAELCRRFGGAVYSGISAAREVPDAAVSGVMAADAAVSGSVAANALTEAARIENEVKKMEQAVIDFGWDGEWFLRAYDALGRKVGSKDCAEGQIFIEPQSFCSIAEIGRDRGLCEKALNSVLKRLKGDFGYELLSPGFTRYHLELGEITSYPPGYKENGSVFCQTNPWISVAAAVNGKNELAFDAYKRICPAYLEDISEIHKTEPYIYCQTIAGREAKTPGEAKNSWLSATSAWSFTALSQYILGIRPDYDGLRIKPCLPAEIREVTVERRFRGAAYHIHIINNGGTADVLIPFKEGQSEYSVEVIC